MFGKSRSAYLVWSMCLLVMIAPILMESPTLATQLVARLLVTAVLTSGVYAVSRRPAHLRLALALLVATVVVSVVFLLFPSRPVLLVNLGFGVLFYVALVGMLVQHIVSQRRVSADTIYTSIAVYMLLTIVWGILYVLAEALQPGAITGTIHHTGPLPINILDALYFSTSTLTSVGYGDILAVSPFARSLAVMEMWVGQLYPAVLISRLVGMYATTLPLAGDDE